MIPPLLEAVLGDYLQNIPPARDAEVLNVMATIVSRLGPLLTDKVPAILAAVFECTLAMINQGAWLLAFDVSLTVTQTLPNIRSIELASTGCSNRSTSCASPRF
jgi:hypothetical protein